ncbi:response regulator [Brevibacterium litoralis]|uniref:response regulator n=1 Tax=Brevibacterium litoralis TaxID=3138935 RepID=UPI0032EE1388
MTHRDLQVLVVDDERGARLLHGRYVAEAPGFGLAGTVGTGLAAVEFAAHHAVDLVLLDMRLPDISGIEVLHRLRTHRLTHVDVLVISSSQDQVTVRQALAGRVLGYLVKPFTQEKLRDRLAAYRESRLAREAAQERDRTLGQGEIDRLFAPGSNDGSGTAPATARRGAEETGAPEGGAGSGRAPRERDSGGRTTDEAPARSPLPRGISAVTLGKVLDELDPVEPVTAVELARRSGISRATARRYLDHLVETGRLDLSHRYGKRGRPEVLYRLAPGA